MALATDQQETMFNEPQEATASLEAELIHHEELAETEEAESGAFGSLDFPTDAAAAPAESADAPVAHEIAPAPVVAPAPAEAAAEAAAEPAAHVVAAPVENAPSAITSAALEAPASPVSETKSALAEPAAIQAAPGESAQTGPKPSEPESAESLPILTAADFTALEERVLRAVSLVRREREARIAAEERATVLEGRVSALQVETADAERLKEEIEALRAEREQVRLRVERLLGQLDALEF